MPISSKKDAKRDLTIFTAGENTSFEEFMGMIQSFYQSTPTKHTLWILDKNAIWDLTGSQIASMAQYKPRMDKRRQGSKTAIVAPDDLTQALSDLFVLLGESKDIKIKVKMFQDKQSALEWIEAE